MREREKPLANQIRTKLLEHHNNKRPLLGIVPPENLEPLVEQIIDSVRRIRYVDALRHRRLSQTRLDATSSDFDPIRAAILRLESGEVDEACWLIFLAIHFGKHHITKWGLVRFFYSAHNQGFTWDWKRATFNPDAIIDWISVNYQEFIKSGYKFGNHRKYESMNPASRGFTGVVLRSYVQWVQNHGGHQALFDDAILKANGDPKAAFSLLYKSMDAVTRFGRTGKFDYLTMVAKVGVTAIEPGSAYMTSATGPYSGAMLLFQGRSNGTTPRPVVDRWLTELDADLGVGMQVIEDALCNWQKSPGNYIRFR